MLAFPAPSGRLPPEGWARPDTSARFVRDVLQAEMNQLRPSGWPLPEGGWLPHLHWQNDLGADSLELLALSAALADATQLQSVDAAEALYRQPTLARWQHVAEQALRAAPPTMRFRTSGSTGAPKTCVHELAGLMQEMQAMAAAIGPVQRIVCAVRCHHIYGFLFSILLPHAMGQPELPLLDLQGRPPLALASQLQAGDLVIGFPDWWRAVARTSGPLPPGVTGVTSTAPCPDEVCLALQALGLGRLLHIYGSSETSGIGWRAWPAPHYQLHPFWQALPEQSQVLQRSWPDGQRSLVTLQDHICWHGDRHFLPGPRLDGAVQIAGVNVHLNQVRERLRQHPAVADVALRVHSFAGQDRLKAFVVPKEGAQQPGLLETLRTWGQQHLAPASRPVHYTLGGTLPVNDAGKACDWAVPAGEA